MKVVVADGSSLGRRAVANAVRHLGYPVVVEASDGLEALRCCQPPTACLITEWDLPRVDGLSVVRAIRERTVAADLPVLLISSRSRREEVLLAGEAGVNGYLLKPFSSKALRVKLSHLLWLASRAGDALVAREPATNDDFREMVRERDDPTGEHTRRVAELSARIATALDLRPPLVEEIRRAAPLHDIGKLAIPDSILLKPAQLNAEEYALMKTHTTAGAAILAARGADVAQQIALAHHERWDGRGYPNRLRGDSIPLAARIVAVADFFDSLQSRRPYREAWPEEQVHEAIRLGAGKQFDPDVVRAFFKLVED